MVNPPRTSFPHPLQNVWFDSKAVPHLSQNMVQLLKATLEVCSSIMYGAQVMNVQPVYAKSKRPPGNMGGLFFKGE